MQTKNQKPKVIAIHRNLTFLRVSDTLAFHTITADHFIAPLIVASFDESWIAIEKKNEDKLTNRLETLGLNLGIKGKRLN